MSFEKHPAIRYAIRKSRSTEPHGALFEVAFTQLTAAECSEFLIVMRRAQKMRDGLLITANDMTEYLNSVDDGFSNEGQADGSKE